MEPLREVACVGQVDVGSPKVAAAATHFAPAERASTSEIHREAAVVERAPLLSKTLDATASMVMILNRKRQIVAANRKLLRIFDTNTTDILAMRPGEAVRCVWAGKEPGGCGTGLHCATCGAVNAVLESVVEDKEAVRECRIFIQASTGIVPLDLRVTACPFQIEKEQFVFVTLEDIGHEKRVAVLQRTFFHDVLNTAGCIEGYVDVLAEEAGADPEICQRLQTLSCHLTQEIKSQRDLLNAETGDLEIKNTSVQARQVLEELRDCYVNHAIAEERSIAIGQVAAGTLVTDCQLVNRILANMLKNALEATPRGGTVTMECTENGDTVTFSVNNSETMPLEVQLQVFQRSFSSKGEAGRGIGTYSMKLFGERYLGGKVDFDSSESEGTTFRLHLPKQPLAVSTASG